MSIDDPTPPADPPSGARYYRVQTAVESYDDDIDRLASALRRGLAERPIDHAQVHSVHFEEARLALEVHATSREVDDLHDVEMIRKLQLVGDRASQYWTSAAATLLSTTYAAVLELGRAVVPDEGLGALSTLLVRTTPLGVPRAGHSLALRRTDPGSAVVQLQGVPATHGATLAAAVRDEIDEQRWGAAGPSLPSIKYDVQRRALNATYRRAPEPLDDFSLWDGLAELAAALKHLWDVVDQIGAVGTTAVEARLNLRRFG